MQGKRRSGDIEVHITTLANDISDRMRMNPANAANYVSNYSAGTAHSACNVLVANNAANDLNCWHDYVDAALPPGSTADITGPVGGLYTVSLSWTDREGQTHTVAYTFQP